MADYSFIRYVFDSSGNPDRRFAFSFPYISKDHLQVRVNGTLLNPAEGFNDWSLFTPQVIAISLAYSLSNGDTVEIQRVSSEDARAVDFTGSGIITEEDLDTAHEQNFYLHQESLDRNSVERIVASYAPALGTDGGSCTASTWVTRPLDTLDAANSGATLGSNELTLPPGRYEVEAYCSVGPGTGKHKVRIQDTTADTTLVGGNSSNDGEAAHVCGVFTLEDATTVSLEHITENTVANTGFGEASNLGDAELFTVLRLTQQRKWR